MFLTELTIDLSILGYNGALAEGDELRLLCVSQPHVPVHYEWTFIANSGESQPLPHTPWYTKTGITTKDFGVYKCTVKTRTRELETSIAVEAMTVEEGDKHAPVEESGLLTGLGSNRYTVKIVAVAWVVLLAAGILAIVFCVRKKNIDRMTVYQGEYCIRYCREEVSTKYVHRYVRVGERHRERDIKEIERGERERR